MTDLLVVEYEGSCISETVGRLPIAGAVAVTIQIKIYSSNLSGVVWEGSGVGGIVAARVSDSSDLVEDRLVRVAGHKVRPTSPRDVSHPSHLQQIALRLPVL